MKATVFILFCAFALALAEDEEAEIELNEIGCPLDPEIVWNVAHDSYCNLFYTCNAGALSVAQICPPNLCFNSEKQICDWAVNVDCGDKGIYERDEEDVEEDDKEESNPGGNSDPSAAAEICAKENATGTLVAHENCDQYYICDSGSPVAVDCFPGLLYNYDKGECDWPFNVVCGDRIVPTYAQLKRAALKH